MPLVDVVISGTVWPEFGIDGMHLVGLEFDGEAESDGEWHAHSVCITAMYTYMYCRGALLCTAHSKPDFISATSTGARLETMFVAVAHRTL